jgi:PilZ domain
MISITEQNPMAARFHPRVEANFMIKLKLNGRSVLAKARDLSMAGVCVLGEFLMPGERIQVAIPLPDDREIVTGASVRRLEKDELAVEFDQLDWDDMFALARFLHPRLP